MARLRRGPSPLEESDEDLYSGSPAPRSRQGTDDIPASTSPSPAVSTSSDKENRNSARPARRSSAKSMSTNMSTPGPTTTSGRASKRRRLTDRDEAPLATQAQIVHERELDEVADSQYYDPDQDVGERRVIRKGLRDLNRDLNDSHVEFLAPGSTGLVDTLNKANEIFNTVKQTSDATLDSRLLVSAADLTYKKTAQLSLGDGAQGIDVDDFVSRCISFMRRGPGPRSDGTSNPPSAAQHRRRHARSSPTSTDDEGVDETDALDWEFFGRRACYPSSRRPPLPSFLLGPLSVTKKHRTQTQRQPRLARLNPNDLIEPEELKVDDIEKVANSNLTRLCTGIRACLVKAQNDGAAAVDAEGESRDLSDSEAMELMEKYRLGNDGGVQLYPFIVNPRSFGQTVENLFYVSFLIRDGSAGVGEDGQGLPTLHATEARSTKEIREQGAMKHQAIFSLDHRTWRELITAFDIEEGMIPDRDEGSANQPSEERAVGARGWYG